MEKDNLIKFKYRFEFEDGKVKVFDIYLEPNTLQLVHSKKFNPEEWTKLENFKCGHCPLNSDEYKYCPVAVHLQELIEFFSEFTSYEKVKVEVIAPERKYYKETDIQSAVSSLIGILMPASGCPILAKLRPMVKFHLPFASLEETEFRVFTMYAFAQYLRSQKNKTADFEMNLLKKIYEDIQKLNSNVASKIAKLEKKDASINSVVVLNNFANSVTMNLDDNDFDRMYDLFRFWLED